VTESEHRRAVAFLSRQDVDAFLQLPDGVRAVAMRDDFLRDGVAVLVEGPSLDPVPEAVALPSLPRESYGFGKIMARQQRMMRAELRGWGPDYTNIDVQCPEQGCSWEHTWEDSVSITEIVRVVGDHLDGGVHGPA
jgi:hypothetical protein